MTSDFDIIDELASLSTGLYFNDARDRAIFRERVESFCYSEKVSTIQGYVRELNWEWLDESGRGSVGPARVGQSRADALRHLASNYIIARQLGEL